MRKRPSIPSEMLHTEASSLEYFANLLTNADYLLSSWWNGASTAWPPLLTKPNSTPSFFPGNTAHLCLLEGCPGHSAGARKLFPLLWKKRKSRSHQAGGTSVHLASQGTDPTCPQLAEHSFPISNMLILNRIKFWMSKRSNSFLL